ncbi:YhcN/YlaJ family sporulation lipoprotein [Brevibacterium sp. JNUCC-42]|nr:YhcN/YlaJ family sporulation lipoprotein [Brevibacterium sp. JNUCC-42]
MKKILYTASCLVLLTAVTACGTTTKQGAQTHSYRTNQMTPTGYGTMGTNNYNGAMTYNGYGYNGYGTDRGNYPHSGIYQSTDSRMRGFTNNYANNGYYNYGQGYRGNAHSLMSPNHAYNRELADRISTAVKKIKGVHSATTVVFGNEAVVGIELKDNKHSSHRRTIEREVNNVAVKAAPHHRIYVTADTKMVLRVKGIDKNYRSYWSNMTSGPNTVTGNLSNVGSDFGMLVIDLGRTITAPFR